MSAVVTRPDVRDGSAVGRRLRSYALPLALAVVLGLLVVRLMGWDANSWLAGPIALLPYAVVVTAGLALACLARRRLRLAMFALALLVVQVGWLAPRFVADGPQPPADGARLRVGTSNTHVGRVDAAALVKVVRTERLDVLALEELTADGIRALDRAGIRALLPYAELHPETDTSLYSRLPFTHAGLLHAPTAWPQTTADIRLGAHTVQIIGVHTYFPRNPRRWTSDLTALAAATHTAGKDVVMLGDFNASLDHSPMRTLLDSGLTDTDAELGHGWRPTWPVWRLLPPLVQLDHVLHGAGLAAVSSSVRTLPGTDHRMVVAELVMVR